MTLILGLVFPLVFPRFADKKDKWVPVDIPITTKRGGGSGGNGSKNERGSGEGRRGGDRDRGGRERGERGERGERSENSRNNNGENRNAGSGNGENRSQAQQPKTADTSKNWREDMKG